MITLRGMTAFYGSTPIVKSVDVAMRPGGCLAVLGRNGVGKTTLLKAIMGLTTRTTGEILLGEDRLDTRPTHERAIAGLGYVPQGRRILGKLTVRENIVLGTFARPDGKTAIPPRCLEMFPYLADNLDRRAGLLSGGQQQQLAIARALATDPKVLLLDEPTEGIQPNIVAEIGRSLIRLNREFGITLILTEQHVAMAKRIATDFIVMDTGRIVESGPIDALSQEMLEQHLTI